MPPPIPRIVPAVALALSLAACGSGDTTTTTTTTTTAAAAPAAAPLNESTLAASIKSTLQRNADAMSSSGKASGSLQLGDVTCDPIIDQATACNIKFFSSDGFSPPQDYLVGGRVSVKITDRRWTVAPLDPDAVEKPVSGTVEN